MLDRTRILPGLLQQLREQGIVAVLTVGVGRATTYVLSLIALTEGAGCEYPDICKRFCVYQNPDPIYTKFVVYTRVYTNHIPGAVVGH